MVQAAVEHARELCISRYGNAPEVQIKIVGEHQLNPFIYVYSHLHHIIFELVKNALRATMEANNKVPQTSSEKSNVETLIDSEEGVKLYSHMSNTLPGSLPPVKIIISEGSEDCTIKVSDEGGGIPRSAMSNIWNYAYTTDTIKEDHVMSSNKNDSTYHPQKDLVDSFSGGGYGLPLARLFARYFGGELTLLSMESYGTDAYLQVFKLGQQPEVIPGSASFSVGPLVY